jgi:hypothetical protein
MIKVSLVKKVFLLAFVFAFAQICVAESDAEKHNSTQMNASVYSAESKQEGGVKVLFIGNSITIHGPAAQIGWTNYWGMAASAREKDYVHIVVRELEKRLKRKVDYKVSNYATFEREFNNWDWSKTEELAKWNPDILIFALGENVQSLQNDAQKKAWRDAFKRLLGVFIDGRETKPLTVVRGSFWPNAKKDWAMEDAAKAYSARFVKADIYRTPGMDAKGMGFTHSGVIAHPGDKGMQEIASRILKGLFNE